MAAIAPVLGAIGTVVGAVGSVMSANQQARAMEMQAEENERRAGEERAASQRTAYRNYREQTRLISTLQARSAASGGGAANATVGGLARGIAQEGSYAVRGAVYEGESRARTLEAQADISRMQARNARLQGYLGAFSTALSGTTDLIYSWQDRRRPQPTGYFARRTA